MNPDVKQKWLDALRSGDYLQIKGYLYLRDDSETGKPQMCCLGVLSDIYLKEHPELGGWDHHTDPTGLEPDGRCRAFPPQGSWSESTISCLPEKVGEWAGVEGDLGVIPGDLIPIGEDYYGDLASINDDGDLGFQDIADIIEERL